MPESTTVYLGEDTIERIDRSRRTGRGSDDVTRSQWVKEACRARLRDEQRGEWTAPERNDASTAEAD